jgi:hypothetical protein
MAYPACLVRMLWPVVLALGMGSGAAVAAPADFQQQVPSAEARQTADWVLDSRDHAGLPFIIVDKVQSRVFVFDGGGRLKGASPALVGLASGDASVPGIGQRALASIRPEERTTPAGRFVASLEHSLQGSEILWVDYDAAIALHPMVAVAKERRPQRLASLTASDRRITYGCINVPDSFFRTVVAPLFRTSSGVVYVLPERSSARELFGSYVVAPAALDGAAGSEIRR